jgi:hypothetical protein
MVHPHYTNLECLGRSLSFAQVASPGHLRPVWNCQQAADSYNIWHNKQREPLRLTLAAAGASPSLNNSSLIVRTTSEGGRCRFRQRKAISVDIRCNMYRTGKLDVEETKK